MSAIKNKRKIWAMFTLFFAIGGLCLVLNHFGFIKALEMQSLDHLYQLKGEAPLSSKIELICVDEKTIEQMGAPPYPAEILQEVLRGLDRLGARVVGVEVDNFQNQPVDHQTKINADLVLGLSKSCTGSLTEVTAESAAQFDQCFCNWGVFPGLPDTANCNFSHLRIDPGRSRIAKYRVPLFLKKESHILPAFAFSILKKYLQVENSQIEHYSDKIIINLKSAPSLKLPLRMGTAIPVTDYGSRGIAEHSSSLIDVLSSVRTLTSESGNVGKLSRFWEKIVIIGNPMKNSGYQTPFASNFNGFFLQATVLTNLLENKFVREAGLLLHLSIYFVTFLLLCRVIFQITSIRRFRGFVILPVFLLLIQILCFVVWGIFIQLWGLLLFVFLSILACALLENNESRQTGIKKVQTDSLLLQPNTNSSANFTEHFVRVVILLNKGEKNVSITHTLETEQDCKSILSAFHRSPQNISPYTFPVSKQNRISAEINRLGEIYYNYYQTKQTEMIKPIELLKRIGEKVYHEFGLSKTFKEIFELQRNPLYLNLVVDDPTIPWQWAYDSQRDEFLCDRFPLSFSFAIEKADLKNFNIQSEPEMPLVNQMGALLLHGNWRGHPTRALSHVDREIAKIKQIIASQDNVLLASVTDPDDFLSRLDHFIHKGINLRIIHYTGHIEDNQMEIGDGRYLKAGTLSQARNLYFYSRPIVFLNGCSSGQLGYLWDKYDDLATEFLACGAVACIITNFDIIETTARKFSETFYYYFISEHLPVGEALRKTRTKLSQQVQSDNYDPDFDITRYFYNLYGDPTARF